MQPPARRRSPTRPGAALLALRSFALLPLALLASAGRAQAPAIEGLDIKVVAEVAARAGAPDGRTATLAPADRVVPGDTVIYTLEVRNPGPGPVQGATVTYPVPEHMRYLADSAVGPGAVVTVSADDGRVFEAPDRLTAAADCTHIRWHLGNTLKAHSVAFLRFRAVVK